MNVSTDASEVRTTVRRHFTVEQKRRILVEAAQPGGSLSTTARRHGINPSLVFKWKRIMDDASNKGLKANEEVVPASEVKALKQRIRELERALGRKTMQVEILEEAVAIAREKSGSRPTTRRTTEVVREGDCGIGARRSLESDANDAKAPRPASAVGRRRSARPHPSDHDRSGKLWLSPSHSPFEP